ncbi:hypothetical protein EH221_04740 [bacterium]|nr:MAG: hypothetical protein EH221_04740 [bacterium]
MRSNKTRFVKSQWVILASIMGVYSLAIPALTKGDLQDHHAIQAYSETFPSNPLREQKNLMLTVGQNEGDLQGRDDKIIQAGIEYLNRMGGGTLRILPGIYQLRNSIHLRPNITLCGSGEETILKKSAGVATPLKRESDWFEYGVQLNDPTGFFPGGGIILRAQPKDGELNVLLATITKVEEDFVFLDRRTQKNFWVNENANASTIFPILTAENVDHVIIKNLVLDGNKSQNEYLNGNYTGAVFIQYCNDWNFNNVTAMNYNGDGYSFQVCDDIHFQDCQSIDNAGLGFHPGSGSQKPIFRNCVARGNSQGIFFCWGVSYGLVDACHILENKNYGINIGHRDTDNIIQESTIERNGKVGILFRKESSEFRSGNRNHIKHCKIRDNGDGEQGIGIDIQSKTRDITISNTKLENTTSAVQIIGIRISEEAQEISLQNNIILNCPSDIMDMRDTKR